MTFTKTLMAVALATAAMGAHAAPVAIGSASNFQMFDPTGAFVGGAAAPTLTGFIDFVAGTWGVASTTPFFGLQWTASGGTLFGPGTYTVYVNGDGTDAPAGSNLVTFTVGAGQLGGNINFAWGATTGIDVFQVWNYSYVGGSMYLISTDIDQGGILGMGMVDGPFPGFSANFNLCIPNLEGGGCDYIPPSIPEASTYGMMLAGMGLVGGMVARRRKRAVGFSKRTQADPLSLPWF
jgi:hypothetical protein